MMSIDLNCDMGESYGIYSLGHDSEVMPFVSSANIACGFHAGDPLVMDATVRLAIQHGVCIGAHPGHPDLQGFGRRSLDLSPDEAEAMVLYQIAALAGFSQAHGAELVHVKPHGALYNQAAKDRTLAKAVARGVVRFSKDLILVGLAGSVSIEEAQAVGLRTANEAFPDRAYNPDGTLRARKLPGAVLESPEEVVAHALDLAQNGIATSNGVIRADTLCLHGDNPSAAENARRVRSGLKAAGIEVVSLQLVG